MTWEINDKLRKSIVNHSRTIYDHLLKGKYDELEEHFELDSQFLEKFFKIHYEGSRFQPPSLSEVLEIRRVGEYSAASCVILTIENGKSLYLENRFALSSEDSIHGVDNEFFVAKRIHAARQIILSIADSLYGESFEVPSVYVHDRKAASVDVGNAMRYYQGRGYKMRPPTQDDLNRCEFTRIRRHPELMVCNFDLPMKDTEKDDLTLSLNFSNCDLETSLDEIDLHVL